MTSNTKAGVGVFVQNAKKYIQFSVYTFIAAKDKILDHCFSLSSEPTTPVG